MHVVIVGNGTAGIHAMRAILSHDPKAAVTMISNDEPTFYSRPEITQLIEDPGGLSHIALPVSGKFWKKVKLFHETVEGFDPQRGTLTLGDGTSLSYDRLILATGAAPKSVRIIGLPNERILTLRTAKDAQKIAGYLPRSSHPVILGGGLIGLKIAHTLTQLGLPPKVIVSSNQILSRTVDENTAGTIQKLFEDNGVEFFLGTTIKSADWDERREEGVLLTKRGNKIPFDLLVAGKGVSPRIELAQKAGLLIENGGIAVSDAMETSSPAHYAAGDCASIFNHETGHYENRAIWPVAAESGRVAGESAVGKLISTRRFSAPVPRNAIPFFSVPIVSIGTIRGDDLKVSAFEDTAKNITRKIFRENGRIVGTVLIGDITHAGLLFEAIREGVRVKHIPDWLLRGIPTLTQQTPSMEVLFS